MAVTKAKNEIALIDVALVTVSTDDTNEMAFTTSNQVTVEPTIETSEDNNLIIKDVLLAKKRGASTLTGVTITLTDNVFNPELVQILQGGTVEYDSTDPTKFKKYTPPVSGSGEKGAIFTLKLYSTNYDTSGLPKGYVTTIFPNCQGAPIAMGATDGTWEAPSYTITSAPETGEAPYTKEYVAALPAIT